MIEIKGIQFQNKGAELMLLTVIEVLRKLGIKDKLVVAPQPNICTYEDYAELGLLQKIWLEYRGIQWGFLGKFVPKKLRTMYGLIVDSEIRAILDASGFAYSDQWGVYPTKMMAKYVKRWKKQGKKIIFLPQAFGPFKTREIRTHMNVIIENANLIYAREKASYEHLVSISGELPKIKVCPDFTILSKGKVPEYFKEKENYICIIPNKRMTDKLPVSNAEEIYIKFLINVIKILKKEGYKVFFLIHGGQEDLELTKSIIKKCGEDFLIIEEKNPILIKGITSKSLGAIGSRFHALVSAFYQGVPAIGIGWSHKYDLLFKEFGLSNCLLSLETDEDSLKKTLEIITDPKKRNAIRDQLLLKSKEIEAEVKNMFREVVEVLNS